MADGPHPQPAGRPTLAGLFRDPAVTDVCVNGSGQVWVDSGAGLRLQQASFRDPAEVRAVALRLVRGAGRRLDDTHPFVDASLPGGIRLHAVLPPVAPDGPHICLRRARPAALTLDELVARGSLPAAAAGLLRRIVAARLNFVVSGGPGTGKTTLLSALLSHADPADRVVVVEDVGEVDPAIPHVVRLQGQPAAAGDGTAGSAGGTALDVLVRQSLRMRPDRVVVGECRGPETAALLAALNTGQLGGCTTVHANSAAAVPARFEALMLAAGLSRAAVHAQLGASLDVALHLRRTDGHRQLDTIGVCGNDPDGLTRIRTAFEARDRTLLAGPAAERLEQLLAERLR